MFVKGQSVIQKVPVAISGVVSSFEVDQQTGELQILVSYLDSDGVESFRHFPLSALEAVV
jgi:hypothetical protein